MERLQVDSALIEYQVRGNGEPVLLLHLSVVADGLAYPCLPSRNWLPNTSLSTTTGADTWGALWDRNR